MPNMYKRKAREALEINRLKLLNKTVKTLKVLNKLCCIRQHKQLEIAFPEIRKPLN